MGKSSHFSGQPLYGQVIKLLDKSKILQFSAERGGERYTKRFNIRVHLVVMLYAIIMRFDSLRETTASLLAETRNHIQDRTQHACRCQQKASESHIRGHIPRFVRHIQTSAFLGQPKPQDAQVDETASDY